MFISKKSFDSFVNVLRGLGGTKDVTYQRRYAISRIMSMAFDELNNLYATNWIAGKIVDIPVNDALRQGRTIQGDHAADIYKVYDQFKIDTKIGNALKWSRAFGGAVLVIVSNDNDMSMPLSIGKGDLKNIAVFDVSDVIGGEMIRDPLSPNYLSFEHYSIKGSTQRVHRSRVIKIDGYTTSNRVKELMRGFGLSIFEKIYSVIGDAQESNDLITNLLHQSNIDVYKMNGLNEAVSADMDGVATNRIQIAQQMKSILNAVILDKDDDYVSIAKNFAGLHEIDMGKLSKVAGAADIPLTRLLGKSADGMNATGEGDLNNYYDNIASYQNEVIYDVYKAVDAVVCAHLGIDIPEFSFNSIFQLTDSQKSEIRNKNAQTDQIYLLNGVIDEIDVMQRLAEDDMYTSITMDKVKAMRGVMNELEDISDPELNPNNTQEESIQKIAMNGAQVSSLIEILSSVSNGGIPRESGIEAIKTAFMVEQSQAEKLMGSIGIGFKPSNEANNGY